jgi:heat shock protein HslJ
VRQLLIILSIFLFSFTIISCSSSSDDGSKSTDNTTSTDDTSTTDDNTTTTDTTAPVIAEVSVVSTPDNDTTPNYTFSTNEVGTITYGGSCSSSTTTATIDNNTVTFNALVDGTYDNCTITVTDNTSNVSNTLATTSFVIDTTSPTVSSISPTDNQSSVSITDNITVTFSEAMESSYVTTTTSDTTCRTETIKVSSDNFSTCVKMSSEPVSSNSNRTFTVDPTDNLSFSTTYKIRVTTGVKDRAGNTLSSQWTTSTGFVTSSVVSWSGTQQLGSSVNDYGSGVTVDSSGNVYVAGTALYKFDSSGNQLWSQNPGAMSQGVDNDSSGNIYVTGHTGGGLDGNTNSGYNDIFLVKYNSSGVKQWTKQLGTSSGDYGNGVAADSSDNIYVTGYTFGGLDGNTKSGICLNCSDIFLVKYNSSGTKQWTKQLGALLDDRGHGVTVDSSNNIYVTGHTNAVVVGLDGNTNSGGYDVFLVKYNSSGTKQWTKQLGTSTDDYGNGVAADSSDNIYVTGNTGGGLDGNTNLGDSDIFLVKYNSDGVKQ